MPLDNQQRIDAAHAEFPGRANGFSEFVFTRVELFDRYSQLTRSLREKEAQGRKDFAPLIGEFTKAARNMNGANAKHLRHAEADSIEKVFNHNSILATVSLADNRVIQESRAAKAVGSSMDAGETPQFHATTELARETRMLKRGRLDNARQSMGTSSGFVQNEVRDAAYRVALFQEEYAFTTAPMVIESRALNGQLSSEVEQYMTSQYAALPDMFEFLNEQKFASQREIIRAFFRDLAYVDPSRRNQPNLISQVKEYWRRVGPQSFDPVIFDRFWEDLNRLSQKNDVIGWVRFGAIVAKLSRDEAGGQDVEPNPLEIRSAVARVPFELWPKPLRDSYSSFVQKDSATLIESIRGRAQQLFPRSYVEVPRPADVVFDSRKRERGFSEQDIAEQVGQTESSGIKESQSAEAKKTYQLGIARKIVVPRNPRSRDWRPTNPLEIEVGNIRKDDQSNKADLVSKLTKKIKSPRAKSDLVKAIDLLLEDPTRKGTKKLEGKEFQKDMPWREADPVAIGIRPTDPETWRYRIIYIIDGDHVGIRAVVHHTVLDKLTGARMSTL